MNNETKFFDFIFTKCKDDSDRIQVLMNLCNCNELDANKILAKMKEEGKV